MVPPAFSRSFLPLISIALRAIDRELEELSPPPPHLWFSLTPG